MNSQVNLHKNKSLKELSTIGIGGKARYLTTVKNIEQLRLSLNYAKQEKLPYLVIGRGSNCLFDDHGFDGLIICNKIGFNYFKENILYVGSGTALPAISYKTASQGWTGLEFGIGIPGSIGGAIYMNASAHNQCISDSLVSVTSLTKDLEEKTYPKEQLNFSYRYSSFQDNQEIIVGATFKLFHSEVAEARQREMLNERQKKQPVQEKTFGCTFRNPPSAPAWKLIQDCGLTGFAIGDAQISPLHANFIINKGRATAQDVLSLIALIKKTVLEKKGIALQEEVKIIPSTF